MPVPARISPQKGRVHKLQSTPQNCNSKATNFEITPDKKQSAVNERATQNQLPVIKVESSDDFEMLS